MEDKDIHSEEQKTSYEDTAISIFFYSLEVALICGFGGFVAFKCALHLNIHRGTPLLLGLDRCDLFLLACFAMIFLVKLITGICKLINPPTNCKTGEVFESTFLGTPVFMLLGIMVYYLLILIFHY